LEDADEEFVVVDELASVLETDAARPNSLANLPPAVVLLVFVGVEAPDCSDEDRCAEVD
jgi:hypothetical protein